MDHALFIGMILLAVFVYTLIGVVVCGLVQRIVEEPLEEANGLIFMFWPVVVVVGAAVGIGFCFFCFFLWVWSLASGRKL